VLGVSSDVPRKFKVLVTVFGWVLYEVMYLSARGQKKTLHLVYVCPTSVGSLLKITSDRVAN